MDITTYVFIDDDGFIADRESMAPTEAQLRNAYAAPGQALRWKPEHEVTSELIGSCVDKLRLLKSRPVSGGRGWHVPAS
jgi:hypothetical protein